MPKLSKKQRQDIEALIYQTFDALDKSHINTEHYKALFATMTDDQFYKFIASDFPYRFHERPFETEVQISDAEDALKILGQKLYEPVALPYLYKNSEGIPVNSKDAMIAYLPLKKVKQFITKKNGMSVDISQRDMKTGLLTGIDKNGKMTDREMESLAVAGLENTMIEFARPRADAMASKNAMYNVINTTGSVSIKDIPIDKDDSLAKNLLNVYLIGSGFNSNLVNEDYYLPYTIKNKEARRQVERK